MNNEKFFNMDAGLCRRRHEPGHAAFADKLTIAGIPVEQVEYWGTEVKKVKTGKILQIDKHPDADKLVVCQVDMGDEQLQIVTAATNVRVGQVVPVAVHGAHLPGGTKIKRSKLRGVLSNGMFCSAHEFGFDDSLLLPEEREGIWILPPDTPLGVDAADYLQVRDVVYEYELTANRADCFSMVGLSREFAVLSGKEARYPEISSRNVIRLSTEKSKFPSTMTNCAAAIRPACS